MNEEAYINAIKLAEEELNKSKLELQNKLAELEQIKKHILNLGVFIQKSKILIGIIDNSEKVKSTRRKKISDIIVDIMKKNKDPMRVSEITKIFYEEKIPLSENNGNEIIRSAMMRRPDIFCKINNKFQLI